MRELVTLPTHPAAVPWPTEEWPTGDPPDGVDRERLDALVALDVVVVRLGRTHADHAPALDAHLMKIVDLFR